MTIDDFIYENSIVRDNGSEYTADHIDRVIESVCNNYGLTIIPRRNINLCPASAV